MRSIVLTFDDSLSFARLLRSADQELALPPEETVRDGEWVLAIFEIGEKGRATAAAGRGLEPRPGQPATLVFEQRDWERLIDFAEASSLRLARAAVVLPPEPPTVPSLGDFADELSVEEATGQTLRPVSEPSLAPPRVPSLAPPLRPPGPPPGPASPPEAAAANRPRAKVLLVDADAASRESVAASLETSGLSVDQASSGESALERARKHDYDVVVMDWHLPGMSGLELCTAVRRDPRLAALPLLFLTANASSRDVIDALESGADDYVVLPFRSSELNARIFSLLRRARMTQASTRR